VAGSTVLLAPTETDRRIVSIDIVRGFAVLGILIMNIQSYSMPDAAYLNPTAYESLVGNHLWVWLASHVFADQKFMSIFSILFGASLIMLSNKARKEHLRSGNLQSRRFAALLFIGLLHAYLLWAGDILVTYAICGFLMYYLRGKKTKTLFRLAVVFLAIGSVISILSGYSVPFWEPGEFEALRESIWSPDKAALMEQIGQYLSNWERQMLIRVPSAFKMQTEVLLTTTLWRVCGLMLIGMGLYKKRIFSTKQKGKVYVKMTIYGLGLGLPLVLAGAMLHFHYEWDFQKSFFFISQFNYWGSVLMGIGYIGIIMVLAKVYSRSGLTKRFAQVGRMALSNYLIQSIICTSIFYGHGYHLGVPADIFRILAPLLQIWTF
jgi:uncharacterized protein